MSEQLPYLTDRLLAEETGQDRPSTGSARPKGSTGAEGQHPCCLLWCLGMCKRASCAFAHECPFGGSSCGTCAFAVSVLWIKAFCTCLLALIRRPEASKSWLAFVCKALNLPAAIVARTSLRCNENSFASAGFLFLTGATSALAAAPDSMSFTLSTVKLHRTASSFVFLTPSSSSSGAAPSACRQADRKSNRSYSTSINI